MPNLTQRKSESMVSHRSVRVPALVSAGLAIVASLLVCSPVSAETTNTSLNCPETKSEISWRDLKPSTSSTDCKLLNKTVKFEGSKLRVPPPGFGVGIEKSFADSAGTSYSLETAGDGTVSFSTGGDPNSDAPAALASPSACSDSAYNSNDAKWDGTYYWYLGNGTRPDGMSTSLVIDRLMDSINNITTSYNDCGYSDLVSATSYYNGANTRESEVDTEDGDSTCESIFFQDGYSVVDFGNLDGHGNPPVAMACWWYQISSGPNTITSVDIRFNTSNFRFTNVPNESICNGWQDLEGVATHEFGHGFGMGHVSESSHGRLTMSTQNSSCDDSQRTLGKGDILGFRSLY